MARVPKQVREAEEVSNQLMQKMIDANNPPPPVVETPPPPAPPVDPPTPPPVQQHQDREDWKAKYYSLKGKFDAEVPRLHQDVKDRDALIARRDATIDDLRAKLSAIPPAPAGPDPLVTQFGEETVNMVRTISAAENAAVRAELEKTQQLLSQAQPPAPAPAPAPAEKTPEQLAAEQAMATFITLLDGRIPDWRKRDVDPEWKKYLLQKAPFTQDTRNAIFVAAAKRGDIETVVEFFEDFERLSAPSAPPVVVPTPSALAALEVPPTAGRTTVGSTVDQWFTIDEVNLFFKEVATGKKYTPDQAAAIQAQIFAAQAAGRIRR